MSAPEGRFLHQFLSEVAVIVGQQRREDIPMLVEYFVKRYAEKARKQINKIDKNTLKLCQSYHWPGNIHELQTSSRDL